MRLSICGRATIARGSSPASPRLLTSSTTTTWPTTMIAARCGLRASGCTWSSDSSRGRQNKIAMSLVPESLSALLTNLVDYAGLYPPAALSLPVVLSNYESYLASPEHWILNRLVLPVSELDTATLGDNCRVTLLVNDEPGALPAQVESLETKLTRKLSLLTYCEAPLDQITGAFAKVRTGGLTPDAV